MYQRQSIMISPTKTNDFSDGRSVLNRQALLNDRNNQNRIHDEAQSPNRKVYRGK